MKKIKSKFSSSLALLTIMGMTVFTSCDTNEQDLVIDTESTTPQPNSLKSLIPPGKSYKLLNSELDITGENHIYLIENKGAELSSLIELSNDKGLNYLVLASNKIEKEALKNSMLAYAGGDAEDNSNLYVLSLIEPTGRKSIFYKEGDYKAKSLFSENSKEAFATKPLSLGEISARINKELANVFDKNNDLSSNLKGKTVFDKYQETLVFDLLSNQNLLHFQAVVKIAKGSTKDTKEKGYGIHVEYLPQPGIVYGNKGASIGPKTRNPDYAAYQTNGLKYNQTLKNLVTSVIFLTEVSGIDKAIVKDHSPIAKIGATILRARLDPHYSFTIGGGFSAGADATGPNLGFSATGGYQYNSSQQTTTITTSDVNYLIGQAKNGKKFGIQYAQDLVAAKEYQTEPYKTPLNNINKGSRLINGGLNKTLPTRSLSTHDHLFNVTNTTLPALSRTTTNPNAMINYFIPEKYGKGKNNVRVNTQIIMNLIDVVAYQTPDEVVNGGVKNAIQRKNKRAESVGHNFYLNFSKFDIK